MRKEKIVTLRDYSPNLTPNFTLEKVIKERVNKEAEAEWGLEKQELPKDISYPKSSLDKKTMTGRTALWAFIKALKP